MEQALCEHGNYHCQTCEIKLLKIVIAEQEKQIENTNSKIETYDYNYQRVLKNLNIAVEALKECYGQCMLQSSGYARDVCEITTDALKQIGEPTGKGDSADD